MKFSDMADSKNVELYKRIEKEVEYGRKIGTLSEREADSAMQQAERELFNISTDGLDSMLGRLCLRNADLQQRSK